MTLCTSWPGPPGDLVRRNSKGELPTISELRVIRMVGLPAMGRILITSAELITLALRSTLLMFLRLAKRSSSGSTG